MRRWSCSTAGSANAIGTSAGNNRFSRYSNPEYDAALDAMAPLASDDPKFHENAVKAMEIYWTEQIDVPIIQWLHRIAYNQTYWTNWPTAENLAIGHQRRVLGADRPAGRQWPEEGLIQGQAIDGCAHICAPVATAS